MTAKLKPIHSTPAKLRSILAANDLTQKAFAELCGFSVRSVHNVCQGRRTRGPITREIIARIRALPAR